MKTELFEKLKYCKLSGMVDSIDRIYKEALDNDLNHLDFFEMLLDEEVINRENRRYERLLKSAAFPTVKTIEAFKFSCAPFLNKKEIMDLLSLDFIDENKNVIFIGDQGTGKTHIVTSIGVEACKIGRASCRERV